MITNIEEARKLLGEKFGEDENEKFFKGYRWPYYFFGVNRITGEIQKYTIGCIEVLIEEDS